MSNRPSISTEWRQNLRSTGRRELSFVRQNHVQLSAEGALVEATPDVRASEVARGKALIADPNYPSGEQMQKVAHLLARHWSRRACIAG